jgi:hypothetical protein
MSTDSVIRVKLAIYHHFAETGRRPEVEEVARRASTDIPITLAAFRNLREQRLLLLEADDRTIRMAPPFSGVPTQHRVEADGKDYFANCAWDALGLPAALHRPGRVRSRCEQSGEPLDLAVSAEGPQSSAWLFHCLVPAARWWNDLVFT